MPDTDPVERRIPSQRRSEDQLRSERLGWLEERVDGLERIATPSASEREREEQIRRAVRDAQIDRDLVEHSEHLTQINGSQRQMASHLAQLAKDFAEQLAVQKALAKAFAERRIRRFSTLQLWLMALGAFGAYGGLIALLISNHHG